LASEVDYDTFQALARGCGVSSLEVDGAYGLIQGSIDDSSILSVYAKTKIWSPTKNQTFVDFFARHEGGTYLDIGAQIGLTTIPIARSPAVSCLAFEPEPTNFRHLQRNIDNNCPGGNVELFNLALFDKPQTLDFDLSAINKGDHRVRSTLPGGALAEGERPVIRVKARPLDALVGDRTLKAPLAAIVNTQGAEAHVFIGGQRLLAQAGLLVFQFSPYLLKRLSADVPFLSRFAAEHFRTAAVMVADEDKPLSWHPVEGVVKAMNYLIANPAPSPFKYFHIFLAK
jgi:FkbM family methyltransferase